MFSQIRLVFSLGLLSLFFAVSVSAQDKPLSDAKTQDDVIAWLRQERNKSHAGDRNARDDAQIAAGNKLLEIAKNDEEKSRAYSLLYASFFNLKQERIGLREEAISKEIDKKIEILLARLTEKGMAEQFRFQYLKMLSNGSGGIKHTEQEMAALLEELATKSEDERGKMENYILDNGRFFLTAKRLEEELPSPENYARFMSEAKAYFNKDKVHTRDFISLGFTAAGRNKVRHKDFVKEMVEFVQSPECTLPTEQKELLTIFLEGTVRLYAGSDPKLYGKTIDNKDFDWESLRGKYVLINFTGTWCGPCREKIPLLLETYERYHNKGLEIVQVYIGERGEDPVGAVRNYVEKEKLPWIIISEALTERANLPRYGLSFPIPTVPVIVLVNKEGEIIAENASGLWLAKLREIFE
jgi:thiol-disulfide isomerase/thioredoxin